MSIPLSVTLISYKVVITHSTWWFTLEFSRPSKSFHDSSNNCCHVAIISSVTWM